ncbi:hypothetical protein AVEN_138796-1, partial [Araneus ventricosus]
MAGMEYSKKCLTFMWMLENASYSLQKKGEKIMSSAFLVDEIHRTKLKLWLYPRGAEQGNYISCYLYKEFDDKDEYSVEIKYELAFIEESGFSLIAYGLIQH